MIWNIRMLQTIFKLLIAKELLIILLVLDLGIEEVHVSNSELTNDVDLILLGDDVVLDLDHECWSSSWC